MRSLFGAALVICFVQALQAAETENPFKKSKSGEWAEYKTTTSVMGNNVHGKVKMTVTAKDDKTATLEVTGKINDTDIPSQRHILDLTKPYDVTSTMNLPKGVKAAVENSGKELEKIRVNGKDYEVAWVKVKTTTTVGNGMNVEYTVKFWLSKDVPAGGIVKMEMTSDFANMSLELSGSGAGK